jgi:polygalacturonase
LKLIDKYIGREKRIKFEQLKYIDILSNNYKTNKMKKINLLINLLIIGLSAFSRDYVITKFGVGTDSTKLSTQAIQKVIDIAAKSGGTLIVPKGVFLSGALFFKPNTRLKLEEGAVIKGSDNIADYPLIPSRMEGRLLYYYAALINAYNVDNFSITGSGTINGNGLKFWQYFWHHIDKMSKECKPWTNLEVHRPRLIFIWNSNNINIVGLKLCNAGYWTTHLYQCNNILIENCDIRSPERPVAAPSTDGIDLDVCSNTIIRNCYISVNDDAICMKGGKGIKAQKLPENGVVENVLIEKCTIGNSHGVLTLGSEAIHVRNIIMRNCTMQNYCSILRIKLRPDTYQLYENITIDSITGHCGTVIDMKPWKQFFNLEGSSEKPLGIVRSIKISNINVKCSQFGDMEKSQKDTVTNIIFKDINLITGINTFETTYKNVKFENVKTNGVPIIIK